MNKIITGAAGVIFSALLLSTSAYAQTDCSGADCPKPGAQSGAKAGAAGAAKAQAGTSTETTGTVKKPAAAAAGTAKTDTKAASGTDTTKKPAAGSTDANATSNETTGSTAKGGTQENATAKSKSDANATAKAETNVTVEQKTKIKQVVKEVHANPVHVDFNISVGVAVPQNVVTVLQPLPAQIVQVVPAYAGYLFFVASNGEIVIVDPNTYEIVFVIA